MFRLKLGIVGCGGIAKEHLKIWDAIPDVKVSALADINIEAAKNLAKSQGIKNYCSGIKDMPEVQAVDICVPPLAHKGVAVEAFRRGYHVLVEKPLAVNLEDAKEIISAKGDRKICVIHNWKFERHMSKAISMAKDGVLGEVMKVDAKLLEPPSGSMIRDKGHWSHSLPGGRVAEALPHLIYILQSFLKDLEVKHVQIDKRGKYDWVPYDELYVTLISKDMSIGTIYISFNSPRHSIMADIHGKELILKVDLNVGIVKLGRMQLGTTGRIQDIFGRTFQLVSSGFGSLPAAISGKLFGERSVGHEICMRNFVNSILKDEEPLVGVNEALENVRLLEEITDKAEKLISR